MIPGEFLVAGADVFLELALGADDLDTPGDVVAEALQTVGEDLEDLAAAVGRQNGDVAPRLAALHQGVLDALQRRPRAGIEGAAFQDDVQRHPLVAELADEGAVGEFDIARAVDHLLAAMGGVQAGFQQVGDVTAAPRDQRQHQSQHRDRDQQADLPRPGHTLASLFRAASDRITSGATPAPLKRCINNDPHPQPIPS